MTPTSPSPSALVPLPFLGASLLALGLACGGAGSDAPKEGEEVIVVGAAPPSAGLAMASRCPEGVKAIEIWQKEYPEPIVHVKGPAQLQGRVAPCDAQATLACQVPPGLYHPWGDKRDGFVTLRPTEQYRLLRPHRLTLGQPDGSTVEVALSAGDIIEMITYLSEGYCQLRVAGQETDDMCPDAWTDEQGTLVELVNPEVAALPQTQLFLARCAGGVDAWIDVDDALFAHPSIQEGELITYGEVGPGQ